MEHPVAVPGWTVQDVAAHLAWAPAASVTQVLPALARAGFRPNAFNADSARRWSRRGIAAILDQLRANARSDAKPLGVPRDAALVDAVVHALDTAGRSAASGRSRRRRSVARPTSALAPGGRPR